MTVEQGRKGRLPPLKLCYVLAPAILVVVDTPLRSLYEEAVSRKEKKSSSGEISLDGTERERETNIGIQI